MRFLFWSSLFLIFFAYVSYPVWLYFRARVCPQPILRAPIFPSVTIVLAAHNEARALPRKIQNLAALDYPQDRLEVIIVSDGSTDETNEFLAAWEKPRQRVVILPKHYGKATALNYGVADARGEIIVFTDARQTIAPDAINNLVANFADSTVGCASGELILSEDPGMASSHGVGLYWRLEKAIRCWEGLAGSTVGATGALYAVRRNLLLPIPEGTVLDDVLIPLEVVRQGRRVVFDPQALVWDDLQPGPLEEFRRKVRTLIGNYQLLQLAPWVLTSSNPVRFQFICHKLLRLLMPFAMAGLLVSTFWLRRNIYELALLVQLAFYALAAIAVFRGKIGVVSRLADISLAFIVLNTAAAIAFLYFVTGRRAVWHGK